ncbi:MAG: ABC transporter permease [Phycisphaeraceae bacterium]|nr:ABC transporter permease [Phycisphaeraceae bacterium]
MNALSALVWREFTRFLRQPSRIAACIGTPAMIWIFLVSGFADAIGTDEGASYSVILAPAMAALTIVFASIFGAISLIEDRQSGFLQAALVSPARRELIALSKVISGSVIAFAQGAVLILPVAFIEPQIGLVHVSGSLVPLACIAVGINGLGLALAWRVDSISGFHGVMNLVLMPMWLLSGGLFPLETASSWLRVIALVNPLSWPIRTIQGVFATAQPSEPWWLLWGATILFAIAGLLAASVTIGRGPRQR